MQTRFAMVRRDELWVRGALAESRLNAGEAIDDGREIVARNSIDAALRARCEAEMDRVRESVKSLRDARVRCVVRATHDEVESTIAITLRGVSVVSTPETIDADYALLRSRSAAILAAGAPASLPARAGSSRTCRLEAGAPFVWKNGSAAVLLHEAIGHAAEHGHERLAWPKWLRVRDESRDGVADLLAGEAPRALRRESFRDVPLRRMTRLIATQHDAPFELPDDRIEIQLVAGGAYEPLTEIVTINVAVSDAGPFTIRAPRRAVARSLVAATGAPIRYPGVICSREGQELYVGSYAPVIVTTDIA